MTTICRMLSLGLLGCAAAPALAQEAPPTPPAPSGTPTSATATVSPITVDQAAARTDRAPSFAASLGTSYASGHFGADSNTTIWSTAFGLRYAAGGLRLNASIPYMRIRSAGTIFSGIDSTPVLVSTATPGVKQTNHGWGDVTLGAAYTLPSAPGGLEVEVAGRVKLPTATDRSDLSSGKTDYAAGLQLTREFGRIAPFASVTYRVLGDSSRYRLRDGIAASAGASMVLGPRFVALASYHYARAATPLIHDAHELFAGGTLLLPGNRLRLTGFATKGLSAGAAAVSGGLSLSMNFGRA